jgi:hypothetical protein
VAQLIPIERMTLRYEHHRDPQEALRICLRELAGSTTELVAGKSLTNLFRPLVSFGPERACCPPLSESAAV